MLEREEKTKYEKSSIEYQVIDVLHFYSSFSFTAFFFSVVFTMHYTRCSEFTVYYHFRVVTVIIWQKVADEEKRKNEGLNDEVKKQEEAIKEMEKIIIQQKKFLKVIIL